MRTAQSMTFSIWTCWRSDTSLFNGTPLLLSQHTHSAKPREITCWKLCYAQQQATEQAFKDPQDLARDILAVLPEVVAVLPRDEVEAVLSDLPRMT